MRLFPRQAVQVPIVIAVLLVSGLGWALIHGLGGDRASLREQFGQRTRVAAQLTADIMRAATDPEYARRTFDVPRARLQAALRAWQGGDPGARTYVLGARGRRLAALPRSAGAGPPADHALLALRTGRGVSDAIMRGRGGPQFELAMSIATSRGRLIIVDAAPIDQVSNITAGYLRSALGVTGARGLLLDRNGVVLSATGSLRAGSHADTAQRAGWTTVHAGVAGTPWTVVTQAPDGALYAPLSQSRTTSFALLAAFAMALAGLLGVGFLGLRRSGQLAAAVEREEAASRLAHERLHDAVTGLPNRALLLDRIERALAASSRSGRSIAVLFADLDRFKRVNDSLGHAVGDRLLIAFAQRLSTVVRPSDTVSRFGGDEFLVLCEDLVDVSEAVLIGMRLQAALDEPLTIDGRPMHVTCSIGLVSHGPGDAATDAGGLVRDADVAMYRAKARGRSRLEVFDAALHEEAVRRLDTEDALRGAVAAGQLRAQYQPIVALPGGEITGVEALVRWQRPGHGLVGPDQFIRLAEDSGLIGAIGEWVLTEAMRTVGGWRAGGLVDDDFVLSVNVSARQLADLSLPGLVAGRLESWELPPRALCLEITETAVAEDPERATEMLARLRALGLRLAIDDFGVGQSSLERVARDLTIDVLKLDRSFVAGMDGEREYAVVATMASLSRSLGVKAVAEGVEDAATAAVLAAMGFPLAQGYHFARPQDADSVAASLRERPVALLP